MFHCHTWVVAALCLAFSLYVTHVQGGQWVPDQFKGTFAFNCGDEQSLHAIFSVYSSTDNDRRFYLQCKKAPYPPVLEVNATTCGMTEHAENIEGDLEIVCGGSPNYVAGFHSPVFHQQQKDRRFKLNCCEKLGSALSNCTYTEYLNSYQGNLAYVTPENKVVRSINTTYAQNDRRYKLEVCDIVVAT